jgi:uncharacterized MAPEG superfamily protein
LDATAIAFLGYVLLTMILLIMIVATRSYLVSKDNREANSFAPDAANEPPFLSRLTRAHANYYECFPFMGGLLLYALATGNTSVTNGLALYLLAARGIQSIIHLVSCTAAAVQIRFAFFIVQLIITGYWSVLFVIQ